MGVPFALGGRFLFWDWPEGRRLPPAGQQRSVGCQWAGHERKAVKATTFRVMIMAGELASGLLTCWPVANRHPLRYAADLRFDGAGFGMLSHICEIVSQAA